MYGLRWQRGNYDPALRFLYQKRNSRYPARQAADAARKLIGRLISAGQPGKKEGQHKGSAIGKHGEKAGSAIIVLQK